MKTNDIFGNFALADSAVVTDLRSFNVKPQRT
jgi:hypothetical protein